VLKRRLSADPTGYAGATAACAGPQTACRPGDIDVEAGSARVRVAGRTFVERVDGIVGNSRRRRRGGRPNTERLFPIDQPILVLAKDRPQR
jgi:hypothetical protein